MPNVNEESGGKLIIASGSTLTFDWNADFLVSVNVDEQFQLKVKFLFEDDESKERLLKISLTENENLISITCINFHEALGTGPIEPLNLATSSNHRQIFLNFLVSTQENVRRKIDYCFYIDK